MEDKNNLAFGKINYLIMIGGMVIIAIGFFIVSLEDAQFGMGSLGLTVGPIIVLLGFITEFFAILYKGKK